MERLKERLQLLRQERLPRRVLLYVFGLFILSLGVSLAVRSNLGVSPIQSMPLVLTYITGLTMGTCVFLVFSAYTLAQIPILGRKFQWYQLAQIPAALVFGYLVDFTQFLLGGFHVPTYFGQLLKLGMGIFLLANGIVLHMRPKLIHQPPDALVAAVATKTKTGAFYRAKIGVDCSLVLLSVLLSLLFLGALHGIREGTIIAAVMIGKCIPLAGRIWNPVLEKLGL